MLLAAFALFKTNFGTKAIGLCYYLWPMCLHLAGLAESVAPNSKHAGELEGGSV